MEDTRGNRGSYSAVRSARSRGVFPRGLVLPPRSQPEAAANQPTAACFSLGTRHVPLVSAPRSGRLTATQPPRNRAIRADCVGYRAHCGRSEHAHAHARTRINIKIGGFDRPIMAVKPDSDRPAVAINVEKMHRVMNNAAELHRRTLRAVEKWQTLVKLADQVTGCSPRSVPVRASVAHGGGSSAESPWDRPAEHRKQRRDDPRLAGERR